MNKFMSLIIVTSVIGLPAYAHILPRQVDSAKAFGIAIAGNEKIQSYVQGRAPATQEVFLEILRFLHGLDNRKPGLNDKINEMFELAEEVGSQLPKLDRETRAELRPIMNSLLNQYPAKVKSGIMNRLFTRFWFWSPENLSFMARLVRNDRAQEISTQLIWALGQATPEERQRFFSLVPTRTPLNLLSWFPLALAYKYGVPVNIRDLKRSLKLVKPENIRPDAKSFTLNGRALATSIDLYAETKTRMEEELQDNACAEIIVADYDSSR